MLWAVWAVLALLVAVVLIRALRFRPRPETEAAPRPFEADAQRAAEHLSVLIQCRTISHADASESDEKEFDRLESKLAELYPNVHRVCPPEKLPERALIYRWRGASEERPLVLTAHYDVVTVDESEWSKPAFGGEIADGVIWGRGALDTKCTLAAILDAAETLIAEGYEPKRDVYFCFSGNEEVLGQGAPAIVDRLEKRGVRPELVVDEGGAIVEKVFPGVKQPCALIGVAEKGNANYRLSALSEGGHASAPAPHSPIDRLARACVRIHDKPFPFRVTPAAAMLFQHLARRSTFLYRMIFSNLWLFGPVLNLICRRSGGEMNALLHTTVAFTQARGSGSANVIPHEASVTLNVRLLAGEDDAKVREALRRRIRDDKVALERLGGSEPSACSPDEGAGFETLRRSVQESYPGVLVSPYLMIAGSDARHYERICKQVYRFSGMALSAEERRMIHGVDERIPVRKQAGAVGFYRRLIENAQGIGLGEEGSAARTSNESWENPQKGVGK